MRARLSAVLLPLAVLLAACGGTSHPAGQQFAQLQVPKPGHIAQVCSGLTDTCVVRPAADVSNGDFSGGWGGVSGCRIPDVSSYQGTVNWSAAKPYICGAVFKGGEYQADPYAARNNSELARLHIWRAMYWFVRDRGCDTEGNQIISAARYYGVKVVANDIEVRESYGYAHCLRVRELAAGLIVVTYGGVGTWPGGPGYGEGPLWQAEYGPVLHPFWRPVVAWQCTDGVYGCATYIPGIGQDDVSVNLGLTSLAAPPPDPWRLLDKHVWNLPFGQHASEYGTVRAFETARCHNPVVRAVCKSSRWHLQLLRDRDGWKARHVLTARGWVTVHPPRWAPNNLGGRFHRIQFDLTH